MVEGEGKQCVQQERTMMLPPLQGTKGPQLLLSHASCSSDPCPP